MIRQPAVSGQFYPADPDTLRRTVAAAIPAGGVKRRALGVISPHAGYVYSGGVAGKTFAAVDIPATVVILGPNHHGVGARAALHPPGSWSTPLGTVPIDETLSSLLLAHAPAVAADPLAHRYEHSLEVQVPFLQYLRPDVAIVPVSLGFSDSVACRDLGAGLAAAIRAYGRDVLIVASSDMSHYESARSAREKDRMALAEALSLNPEGLLSVCSRHRITMCGVIPAAVMLAAVLELGATAAELIAYATSGDITGDDRQVVGYAGVAVW